MMEKKMKKSRKKKKKKCMEELHVLEKMIFLDSDEESLNNSSSKEGKIWKVSSDEELSICLKHTGENL